MRAYLPRLAESLLPPLVSFVVFLLLWHGAVVFFHIPPFLLPGPLQVAAAIQLHGSALVRATWLTALGAVSGFSLSFAAGFLIAVLFSQSRLISRGLYPYAIFLQTVPIVAIAPLIVLWIGHGFWGVVTVSFIISLFPVIANTTAGLARVEPHLLDLFSLYNASRWQVLCQLRIPSAVSQVARTRADPCS